MPIAYLAEFSAIKLQMSPSFLEAVSRRTSWNLLSHLLQWATMEYLSGEQSKRMKPRLMMVSISWTWVLISL